MAGVALLLHLLRSTNPRQIVPSLPITILKSLDDSTKCILAVALLSFSKTCLSRGRSFHHHLCRDTDMWTFRSFLVAKMQSNHESVWISTVSA
jgi:hypothetical protein